MVDVQRSVLPIPERAHVSLVTYDAKDPDTSFPPMEPLRRPAGAPNVLIVLIDDCGFWASSAFGGPISTPTAERLAARGLKYNRFHTTALCSPTRQALLTGRNHHAVGMGAITELATSAPGYSSVRPANAAPLAETLLLNGYSTGQFGKCHEVPVWETSPMGPFRQWPTGSGFEYFYGFVGGETNQYYPALYEGTTPVEPPATPAQGYHFTEDMTDKAISWFAYDGGGLAKGGTISLYLDGNKVGDGRAAATVPMMYSGDETCDLGIDNGSNVSDDYTPQTSRFTGIVNWVQLNAGDDNHDHLISPEDRLKVAMARQ